MNVVFDNKDGYFEEMRQAPHGTLVRAEVFRNEINRGVTQVAVLSGYFDQQFFYQANIPCGEDCSPKKDGSEQAEAVMGELKGLCEQSGLALRKGQWQLL